MKPITIAVPKGRINQVLLPLLQKAGLDCACLAEDDRTLIRTSADGRLRYLLLKPDDVPTYVEYGAAELGISGRDTLLERYLEGLFPVAFPTVVPPERTAGSDAYGGMQSSLKRDPQSRPSWRTTRQGSGSSRD